MISHKKAAATPRRSHLWCRYKATTIVPVMRCIGVFGLQAELVLHVPLVMKIACTVIVSNMGERIDIATHERQLAGVYEWNLLSKCWYRDALDARRMAIKR
jgi:hypothetical protein